MAYMDTLIISMPGFSQQSYDKIHGFDFEQIKRNIIKIKENYQANGFCGTYRIALHQYQFNESELPDALAFAERLGMTVSPYCACLVDYYEFKAYREGTMQAERLKKAEAELYLSIIDKTTAARPPEFRCPNLDICTVDCAREDILLCCLAPLSEPGAPLWDATLESIYDRNVTNPMCLECKRIGLDYTCNNLPTIHND